MVVAGHASWYQVALAMLRNVIALTFLAIGADWLGNSADAMEDMVFQASMAASVMAVLIAFHLVVGGRD
eukprot:2753512-Pyramimonas_sp.AAC.1